jgi:hypothetical protein
VARLSLFLAVSMLFGVPTCLVTSTTEFPQPVPSAPFLLPNYALATPEGQAGVPPTKMLFIDPGPGPAPQHRRITFSAPVQSEDNGRPLLARAFVDFNASAAGDGRLIFGGGPSLEPSTFDDDSRTITAVLEPWHLSQIEGCHQVTLVVSHLFDNQTMKPVHPDDTTFVVWWMLIEHEPGTHPASKCPPGAPAPAGDAGLDAEAGP